MYFKSIEMTGFKSFADRTVLNLEPGMTAIVGPNGCGKSNILDAVRWALGEQSAKALRGSHMQDVIFNGSEERTATGMAEVTLVFDNADSSLPLDFAEVQITRRVYRSGESEYLINKAPCRLRDIQELFMDTGVGTNAYSMIGQGKIGMVLSSKPEDRRFLFEEAAGIIKYKSRKRIAMRKLEQADQNLLRLGDIIAEVERQMRSLKRQVNAAIRYRELTEQLRELEIRAAWLKQAVLVAEIDELRTQFGAAQDTYEKANTELGKFEARHEELGLAKLEVDRVLHARREGVHEIDQEMEKIERLIALIRQQIEFSGEQQRRAAQERNEFLHQSAALEEERRRTGERAAGLKRELDEAEAALAGRQAAYQEAVQRVQRVDETLEVVRGRAVESMGMRAKTQTAIETLTVSIENLDKQLEALYERQESEGRRRETLLEGVEELRRAEAEKHAEAERFAVEKEQLANKEAEVARQLQLLNEAWQGLRETKSSVEARLHSLRELRDSYEGFAAGVRAVMQAKQEGRSDVAGVIGPVGDLISTDEAYERAVEAALGGNIHNIAVETAYAAKSAIGFLKEHRAGRVTFLPLDIIRVRQSDDAVQVLGLPGVVGRAVEFVRFDERVRPVIEYLFHNTVLVQTIDDAIRIARESERRPRLVTLDGEVISPAGAVTGGRTRHESRGLIGRSAEIAELEQRLAAIAERINESAEQGRVLVASLSAIKAECQRMADLEETARRDLQRLGIELAGRNRELSGLIKAAESLKCERDDLAAERIWLENQRRQAIERASAIETESERLQKEIAQAQDAASRARQEQSLLADELSDRRVKIAELRQMLEEIERDAQRIERARESALREADRRDQAIAELKANQSSLEDQIRDHIERSKALSESKEEARRKVIEAENQRQALLDESDKIEKRLREVRERSREAQSALHRIELDLRRAEDQLGFFRERIQSEYHVALGSLTAEEVGTDDYEEAAREEQVEELRVKIERMGAVNLMAIEEYDALSERHDFLTTQFQDLTKARDTLLGVVARIDSTIRDLFLDTFNAVGQNFHEYFRRLFNGGHARVYLLNEDDPLESGIEIEARPPGKKPQSISLLSGGEQAMTAIALLFSIFKAKPSPFCVLDEVDAPLDDANIGRFLSLLEEFTVESQFVVITHNKQTMSRADALYGVTQQERGVSQLVSVKFDEVRVEAEPAA